MEINKSDTAVLITDPQNDFLSEKGVTWEPVGDGYKSALVNFGYIANEVLSTDEVEKAMGKGLLEAV